MRSSQSHSMLCSLLNSIPAAMLASEIAGHGDDVRVSIEHRAGTLGMGMLQGGYPRALNTFRSVWSADCNFDRKCNIFFTALKFLWIRGWLYL